jgi:phage terminase Nu1 subunit (DNA packaging protein)
MNPAIEGVRLVKKKELAHLLAVSPRTIDNWVSKGVIPYIAITPRLHLFDSGAVRRVIEERFGVCAAK